MSQSSYFKSRPDLVTLGGGEVGGGNWKSWETLRVERSGSNLVARISKCRRYVIDVTGLDLLYLRKLGGGEFQCFCEFCASGRAMTTKPVGVSETCTN